MADTCKMTNDFFMIVLLIGAILLFCTSKSSEYYVRYAPVAQEQAKPPCPSKASTMCYVGLYADCSSACNQSTCTSNQWGETGQQVLTKNGLMKQCVTGNR